MEIISSMLLHPTFPEREIQDLKEQTLNSYKRSNLDINNLSSMLSGAMVFGEMHPLGRQFSADDFRKITKDKIKEFYQFNYTPKNTKIVISGKPDKEKVKQILEDHFGKWEASLGQNSSALFDTPVISGKSYYFINKNKATQAALRWTKNAPKLNSKNALPFKIASTLFNEVLFDEIRGKEGKTYGIYSSYNEASNAEIYTVTTQVRSEVTLSTINSFERVLGAFQEKGMTKEQLASIKKQFKNSYLSIERPGSIASLVNPWLYPNYEKRQAILTSIDEVALKTVNKVIQKYFSPKSYILVIAGDEGQVNEQISKLNGIQKKSLAGLR